METCSLCFRWKKNFLTPHTIFGIMFVVRALFIEELIKKRMLFECQKSIIVVINVKVSMIYFETRRTGIGIYYGTVVPHGV